MRKITYCEAINEAIIQEMERDPSVFVYGLGVPDHKRIFCTTKDILEKFGPNRCFDTPLSEDAMTGFGLGAAINGLKPIHIHIRVDFLLLAMNQLANIVSSYIYASCGRAKVQFVIRAIIGRGWGQGYQHSKSMQSIFAHIPGLKVVMPTTPKDAKGLLVSAIRDDNPVLFIEHQWLYLAADEVPKKPYTIPIGIPCVLRHGRDMTIVATSWMNVEALKAAWILEKKHGVSIEIIDVRTLSPLEDRAIIESVNKTGRCIIADNDWVHCGYSAELAARISEKCFGRLKMPVERIGFAFTPCPTAKFLENEFYPNAFNIVRLIEKKMKLKKSDLSDQQCYSHSNRFKGPF